MTAAALLFAVMGVCVKLAAALYSAGEMVMYRSIFGLAMMLVVMRWRGLSWRTAVPGMHLRRSISGTTALCMWFYCIATLPLATAMTLNYMSPVWMAVFLIAGALFFKPRHNKTATPIDRRLVATVIVGFVGVACVLQPTLAQNQVASALVGLASGMLAAVAYLQVSALGRIGEPGPRVVFYFSASGVLAGGVLTLFSGPTHHHTAYGVALLLAIGLLATTAQWMMTTAYGTGATLGIAALQYLGIAFSFVFGVVIFSDTVTPLALAGMLLIVGAGLAATFLRSANTVVTASNVET
jgi:drug/metabolite transporter (DMT)-like permease